MLLAIDVGNTNTVLGLYGTGPDEAPGLLHHFRIATNRAATADEMGELIPKGDYDMYIDGWKWGS